MSGIAALALALAQPCVAGVYDGDTLRLCSGERVRLVGIDAPETRGSPRCTPKRRRQLARSRNPAWCDYAAGERAKQSLARFLAQGPVRIERQGRDRYQRTLARVTVNGRDVGAVLVGQGLARVWRK